MRARPDREVAVVAVPARPGAILIRPDAAADPADATAVAYAITPRAVARLGRPRRPGRPPFALAGPARDRAANRVGIGTMYPPPND